MPLLNRQGSNVWTLDDENQWIPYPFGLDPSESVLAQLSEPHRVINNLALPFSINRVKLITAAVERRQR